MRHLGSVALSMVLGPIIWLLAGLGLANYAQGRTDFTEIGGETALGTLLLLMAGACYTVLIAVPISPLGPALTGIGYLALALWNTADRSSFFDVLPHNLFGEGFVIGYPAEGYAFVLAVPLVATVLNARRWRGSGRPAASYPVAGGPVPGGPVPGGYPVPGPHIGPGYPAPGGPGAAGYRPPGGPGYPPAGAPISPPPGTPGHPIFPAPPSGHPAPASGIPGYVPPAPPSEEEPTELLEDTTRPLPAAKPEPETDATAPIPPAAKPETETDATAPIPPAGPPEPETETDATAPIPPAPPAGRPTSAASGEEPADPDATRRL